MGKRSQIYGQVFIYVLAVLIAGMILLFGIKAVNDITNRQCKIEYPVFIRELMSTTAEMKHGDMKIKEFNMPCKTNKFIFVDSEAEESLAGLSTYPIINDALESGTANVFILDKSEIKESFRMDNLKIGFPYYKCYKSINEKISIRFESDGEKLSLEAGDNFKCSFSGPISIELNEEDLNQIINEIADEFMDISEYLDIGECNIQRKIEDKDGETHITITKNQDCEFTFFEKIPKCALGSIQDAIDSGLLEIEGDITILNDDPLMMWDFELGDENSTYIIKKLIIEGCKEEFVGLPVRKMEIDTIVDNQIAAVSDITVRDILVFIKDNTIDLRYGIKAKLNKLSGVIEEYESGAEKDDIEKKIEDLRKKIDKIEDSLLKDTLNEKLDILEGYYG